MFLQLISDSWFLFWVKSLIWIENFGFWYSSASSAFNRHNATTMRPVISYMLHIQQKKTNFELLTFWPIKRNLVSKSIFLSRMLIQGAKAFSEVEKSPEIIWKIFASNSWHLLLKSQIYHFLLVRNSSERLHNAQQQRQSLIGNRKQRNSESNQCYFCSGREMCEAN